MSLKRSRQRRQPGASAARGAGRGSETLFHDRITAAAWRFKPGWQAVSKKDRASRRGGCPVTANQNCGWRTRRQLNPSTPPGEIILRAEIYSYSATAILITSQAIIADSSRLHLSVQNVPICAPPLGSAE
jgi:hypothetical protein